MNPNLSYEIKAAAFHRMTGMMAPGKDEPAACGGHSYTERETTWLTWQNDYRRIIRAMLWAVEQNAPISKSEDE